MLNSECSEADAALPQAVVLRTQNLAFQHVAQIEDGHVQGEQDKEDDTPDQDGEHRFEQFSQFLNGVFDVAVIEAGQFDQHLVRRFSQLMGIYPPGNMVRLDTGEIAVVLRVYAPDPYKPRVRVVIGADGEKLARPRDANLWESSETASGPKAILSPVEAGAFGLDPLTYL